MKTKSNIKSMSNMPSNAKSSHLSVDLKSKGPSCPHILVVLLSLMLLANTGTLGNENKATEKPHIADKDKIFKQLAEKYKNAQSISIDMEAEGSLTPTLLKAKRGNNFIIQIGELQITSNGKTVWNYNRHRQTVIISNYEDVCNDMSFTNITLDNFFFELLPKLQPISLSSVLSSSQGKSHILKLQSKENDLLQQVNIYLDNALNTIQHIEIVTSTVSQKFKINKIEVNKKMANSIFEFKIPKNVEIING